MLTTLVFVFIALLCNTVTACDDGWFGPNCEYKCHCYKDANCDDNGTCKTKCADGWFGPACQYEDVAILSALSTRPTAATIYLADGNDNTCINITSISFDTMGSGKGTIFTWLRITLQNEEMTKHPVSLTFKSYFNGYNDTCENFQSYVVDSRTRDLYCYRTQLATVVYIEFSTQTAVCSLQISGGHNLALKQQVKLSDLFNNDTKYNGSNAVDGSFSDNCANGGCAFTGINSTNPSFVLTLTIPAFIYRIHVYVGHFFNAKYDYTQTWYNFTAHRSDGVVEMSAASYDFVNGISFISTTRINNPIKNFTIKDSNITDGIFIILREVELYGELSCPSKTYGLGCEKKCHCAHGESCFVSTGGCPSGCPVGFKGVDCTEACDPGYYGANCLLRCSNNCSEQLCDQITGHCYRCHPGYYGDTCELRCSDHCAGGGMCDVNGTCRYGCSDGYHGDKCLDACEAMKYGTSCTQTCSPNCKPVKPAGSTTCHYVTGACLLGCHSGYLEPTCSEASATTPTSQVVNIIIGVGVVVVLVVLIVVVGCVVYRRLSRVREDVGSGSTTNNNNTAGFDMADDNI